MTHSALSDQTRPFRILWANCYCLLDTSSGASMAVHRILHQLKRRGFEIQVIGATVFDTPHGVGIWKQQKVSYNGRRATTAEFDDDGVPHKVALTKQTTRSEMTAAEESVWHSEYIRALDTFKPDLVMTYGGLPLDLLTTHEARRRGIPVAFYLGNGGYSGSSWCQDVDLIMADSMATAKRYWNLEGIDVAPVGAFIHPRDVVAEEANRERVLFVNPSLKKGAAIVAALAAELEDRCPDITFEVVEARGDWDLARRVSLQTTRRRLPPLRNVVLTPNTNDMRPVFARARLLLAPSLWWESGPRVAAEAMMNGIPVIASNFGGLPEQIGDAGILFDFPDPCHQRPFTTLPPRETLSEMARVIERLYDDDAYYRTYAARTDAVVTREHDIERNTDRVIASLMPLLKKRAGDANFEDALREVHVQRETIKHVG